jgi:deazaflavin-dependent oxidoreductase (nitroreductase family)
VNRQHRAETSDAGPPADLPPVPTYAQVQDDPTALHLFNEQIVAEFRRSGGVVDGPFRDSRVLLLTMTGARSGRRRLTPLEYFSIDERIILIGSFGGAPRNPVWVHNLRAHPDVKVEIGETAYDVVAHEMSPEEGARLLSVIESQNPRVAGYPKPDRRIPVFELRPTR